MNHVVSSLIGPSQRSEFHLGSQKDTHQVLRSCRSKNRADIELYASEGDQHVASLILFSVTSTMAIMFDIIL